MFPTLRKECSIYLETSGGKPLERNLLSMGDGFRKVKVRKKQNNLRAGFVDSFNDAFPSHKDLLKRCVFARHNHVEPKEGFEPFYIFPINGFKFLYSPFVRDTASHYGTVFDKLIECIGDVKTKEVFTEILLHQYMFENLEDAISSEHEILIYNIPYYYAIRKSLIVDYQSMFYNS